MPPASVWGMPAGILGVMSMPLGLDGFWWRVMGHGIDWMISVAQWVSNGPARLRTRATSGTGPLLLCSTGLVVLCLLKTPLRLKAVVRASTDFLGQLPAAQPDVMIAADGSA